MASVSVSALSKFFQRRYLTDCPLSSEVNLSNYHIYMSVLVLWRLALCSMKNLLKKLPTGIDRKRYALGLGLKKATADPVSGGQRRGYCCTLALFVT